MNDIVVQLPDGSEAHFPDGTQPQVMQAALQKQFGAPTQAPQSAPQDPEAMTQAFYQAKASGNEPTAAALFHGLRQAGATLRSPTQDELAAMQGSPSAANGLGDSGENFASGMGKSVMDNIRGIAQSGVGLARLATLPTSTAAQITGSPDLVGQPLANTYAGLKQDQSDVNQRDAPLMHTGSGLLGDMTGQAMQAVAGGTALKGLGISGGVLPQGYGGTALSGAVQGALQPLSSDQGEGDRALNAAIGAGAGVAGKGLISGTGSVLGRGAGLLAGSLIPKASPEASSLAKTAIQDYGIPLKASQVSGSQVAKTLDSVSSKIPFSGADSFAGTQQKAFNRAVASTIGEDADSITPALYSQAKKRIGQTYDDITARNTIDLSGVQDKLGAVLQEAQQTGSDDSVKAVTSLLGRIADQAPDGLLPGKAFQSVQSQLGTIAKSGGEKGNYAGQLRGLLSSALDDSISPADKAAWQTANQQYGNLKTIRDLVTKDQVSGNISPAALLGRVTANGAKKEAVATGRGGDLAQLAAIGQQFMKDGVPNSGTPERLAAYGLLGPAAWLHLPSTLATIGSARAVQGLNSSAQVLARVMRDPSIDTAAKSALLQKIGSASGLLGQQSTMPNQRQSLLGGAL